MCCGEYMFSLVVWPPDRFNMPHDDSNKCKEEGVKIQQHVMAPTLNYYTNPWMWSKCSRKYITEFLEYVTAIVFYFRQACHYGEELLSLTLVAPHCSKG